MNGSEVGYINMFAYVFKTYPAYPFCMLYASVRIFIKAKEITCWLQGKERPIGSQSIYISVRVSKEPHSYFWKLLGLWIHFRSGLCFSVGHISCRSFKCFASPYIIEACILLNAYLPHSICFIPHFPANYRWMRPPWWYYSLLSVVLLLHSGTYFRGKNVSLLNKEGRAAYQAASR